MPATPIPTMRRAIATIALAPLLVTVTPAVAAEPPAIQQAFTVTASDGVDLRATLTGPDATTPRPTLVEFSPYGRNSGTLVVGPAYNTLLVQLRGTGDSDGSFDALGSRTQKDVREVLEWACQQPWSDGKLAINGSSGNAFEGKGATGSDNLFSGTITVTVVEVLPNGNLVVAGEKQVGINQNIESLRFAGVVSPINILPGNFVSSTQVADARMQVRGKGDIDRAQTTGWLSRFFLSFLPI